MIHAASVSGGRTSMGPMIKGLLDKYGKDSCAFIFCDTGAEDVDTYRFIKDVAKELDIKITCLRLEMPKQHRKGGTWGEISIDEIGQDYYAWKQLTSKYGNPYMPSGKFCTQQMKGNIFKKYCDDTFGKDGYYTWLGYRYEEGNRLCGKHASVALGKLGLNNKEKTQFYLDYLKKGDLNLMLEEYLNPEEEDYTLFLEKLTKAIDTINTKTLDLCQRYLRYRNKK